MDAERGNRRRARVIGIAVLLATFAAGALVGVASERVLGADEPDRSELRRPHRGPRDPFAPGGPLTQRLELTEEQQARISEIVAANRAKSDSLFRAMRPAIEARFDSTNAAIREVLTPEQRETFDRYRQERRERMRMNDGMNPRRRDGRR